MESVAAPTSSSSPPKRNRPTLSCVQCRQAKAKCDRQHPCALCIRKGRGEHCTYPLPVSRKKAATSLQKRLQNLESMVKVVIANNEKVSATSVPQDFVVQIPSASSQIPHNTTASRVSTSQSKDVSDTFTPASHVILEEDGFRYISNNHWKSLLENVRCLPR